MANIQKITKLLNVFERSTIEIRWCKDGKSQSEIALELGRNRSTIFREINKKPRKGMGRYRADLANISALERIAKRGEREHIAHKPLRTYVIQKLKEEWSPEIISVRLLIEYPNDLSMRISYETIYQYIYAQIHRGGNGEIRPGCEDLRPFLLRRHKRRAKKGFRKAQKLEKRASLPSIEDRPDNINERVEFGHWEDDTMVSKESLARLKTITERVSRVHLILQAINGTAIECDRALRTRLATIPSSAIQTITRDRGSENMEWEALEKELGVTIYFVHPHCSHERGTNENRNGYVRRDIPKGCDFGKYTSTEIHEIEYKINNRPMIVLGGLTPCEVYYHSTGVALYS